ncbi:MAG: DNA gyrase inhibitor YacG [Verrucomicrobiae bacterium]|nr:DNA gyrase inhibitor YacG [Verrucomicrobiae bacterium]
MSLPNPKVRCPTCGKVGDWFAGPFGPFCSRRCKLIDLGKWLGEEHVISEPLRPEHLEELSGVPRSNAEPRAGDDGAARPS